MLKSHLTHDYPKEANFTTYSAEGITDEPADFNTEFTPFEPLKTISTVSQRADEETSITSIPTQQIQTIKALSTSSHLSPYMEMVEKK